TQMPLRDRARQATGTWTGPSRAVTRGANLTVVTRPNHASRNAPQETGSRLGDGRQAALAQPTSACCDAARISSCWLSRFCLATRPTVRPIDVSQAEHTPHDVRKSPRSGLPHDHVGVTMPATAAS